MMNRHFIEVMTRHGTVTIPYHVGLFQGSMLSVVISNLVSAFKFRAWKEASDVGYTMDCMDERDAEALARLLIWVMG